MAEGIQKNNGDHYGGELLALFGDHLFVIAFFLNLR